MKVLKALFAVAAIFAMSSVNAAGVSDLWSNEKIIEVKSPTLGIT
jgi:hypothetical protein